VSVAHQPLSKINTTDCTGRHGALVLIQRNRNAAHRAPVNKGIEIIGSLRSAAILQAVITTAELRALRRVDAPQSNARAVNF